MNETTKQQLKEEMLSHIEEFRLFQSLCTGLVHDDNRDVVWQTWCMRTTDDGESACIERLLMDRIHVAMDEYIGTPKHIKYYHQILGYEEIAAKLKDEGFDDEAVEDAIDAHGNKWWLKP